jgi:protein gp37
LKMREMVGEKRLAKGLWWTRNWELLNGCSEISPACDNCFAREYIKRFQRQQEKWQGLLTAQGRWNGTVRRCTIKILDLPLRTKKPAVWFVTERGDLFHENVPVEFLCEAFNNMLAWRTSCKKKHEHDDDCEYTEDPGHIFLLLTKRPERMLKAITEDIPHYASEFFGGESALGCTLEVGQWLPDHIWTGVTAENQEQADKRIPELLKVPGNRFISVEPMLGPVDLSAYLEPYFRSKGDGGKRGRQWQEGGINWVICGGESNPNARPMHPDWVRSLRDQCAVAGVPFFFKQWGEWQPIEPLADEFPTCGEINYPYREAPPDRHHDWDDYRYSIKVGKKKAGRLLDGREHLAVPE